MRIIVIFILLVLLGLDYLGGKVYSGPVFELAIIGGGCRARNTGERVWMQCYEFFENKRLIER